AHELGIQRNATLAAMRSATSFVVIGPVNAMSAPSVTAIIMLPSELTPSDESTAAAALSRSGDELRAQPAATTATSDEPSRTRLERVRITRPPVGSSLQQAPCRSA